VSVAIRKCGFLTGLRFPDVGRGSAQTALATNQASARCGASSASVGRAPQPSRSRAPPAPRTRCAPRSAPTGAACADGSPRANSTARSDARRTPPLRQAHRVASSRNPLGPDAHRTSDSPAAASPSPAAHPALRASRNDQARPEPRPRGTLPTPSVFCTSKERLLGDFSQVF